MELKKLKELIGNEEFCRWADLRGWRFKFSMYQNHSYMDAPLEVLELSVRSFNSLKRAGFSTINDVVSAINGRDDLRKFRNLGSKSTEEIIVSLFTYQYINLKDEKKVEYLKKIISMN